MKPLKLYLIAERSQFEREHGTVSSLRQACKRAGMACEQIVVDDLALADIGIMQLEPDSLLYRVSTGVKASIIESMLVTLHPGTFTTIHYPQPSIPSNRTYWELCVQIEKGLRVIPTLIVDETWQQMDIGTLNDSIAEIGGFPVIAKELGLSHGQGVSRLDTAQDLLMRLHSMTFEQYGTILRKYLADYRHFRLIVVDGKVIAAIEYHKPVDDFRTNASEAPEVSAVVITDLSADLIQLAIDSVALRQSIIGGVDILVDQEDQTGYLAEVNVPCYYPRAEGPTGVDVSGELLAALVRKRKEDRE